MANFGAVELNIEKATGVSIASYNDTGIMTVKQAASGTDQYYDLQGRKVTVTDQSAPALRKGIYVKNGKKYYLSPLK